MTRTRESTPRIIAGRLARAREFSTMAISIDGRDDVRNVFVNCYVNAGIAASDVICCIALGEHAQGDNHVQAAALLTTVQPDGRPLGAALRTLLSLKSTAAYGADPVSRKDAIRARRAMEQLVEAANSRRTAVT